MPPCIHGSIECECTGGAHHGYIWESHDGVREEKNGEHDWSRKYSNLLSLSSTPP